MFYYHFNTRNLCEIWQAASVINDVLARYSKLSCCWWPCIATTSTSGTVESLYI